MYDAVQTRIGFTKSQLPNANLHALRFNSTELGTVKTATFPVQGMLNSIPLTNGITKQGYDANEMVKMMAKRPNVSSNDDVNGLAQTEWSEAHLQPGLSGSGLSEATRRK